MTTKQRGVQRMLRTAALLLTGAIALSGCAEGTAAGGKEKI